MEENKDSHQFLSWWQQGSAGAEEIIIEYEHGDGKIKSQQAAMFDQAAAGDTVIALEGSRLVRSTQQLFGMLY